MTDKEMRKAIRQMMADFDCYRAEQAERFASALQSTTDRYLAGCMTRPTWRDHMRSLWGRIEHAGLRADVMRLVDPLAQSIRR